MSIRVGTDIVEVARIESLLAEQGDRFLRRWFTDAELTYCQAKANPAIHLAGRLAAKEAVAKVLRAGWEGPLPWMHIEVVTDGSGAPDVLLSDEPRRVARSQGLGRIEVSVAHCETYATATAVCLVN